MFRRRLEANARLSRLQRIIYGMPSMPHAFIALPLYMLLPAYYAGHTHVTLAEVGAVAALGRVFDAACDPVIGFLSDRTRAIFGTRKPWALGSMLFCALSATQLFQPPASAGVGYFALWSALLYVGFTMFEVPNSAWGAELSLDYAERTRIGASKALFNIAGSVSSYILPIGMYFITKTTEINGSYLKYLSILYVIAFPIFLLISIFVVPNGPAVQKVTVSLKAVFASLAGSRVLQWFYLITALWGLGQGFLMSTIFIFVTDYLGLKSQFPFLMVALFVAEMACLPLWTPILKRIDRHQVWSISVGALAILSPLVLILPKGSAAVLPFIGFACLRSFFSSPNNFVPAAVLGDVIDYDTLRTGTTKAGNFFALQLLLIKIAMAAGGAGAFYILDRAGYKVGQANSGRANMGLLIAYVGVPLVAHLATAAVAWDFPITRRRHKVIQASLERRARRAAPAPSSERATPALNLEADAISSL